MRMRNLSWLLIFLLPVIAGCNPSGKKVKEQTIFPYTMSVTAPKEYPVEVHLGYFSNAKGFVAAIPKAGMEHNGWTIEGSDAGTGAGAIPSHLDLTWISYTEKKFWKVDTALPAGKILVLFRKGYADMDGFGKIKHSTYDHLVIGVAPGGVVVVWLQGRFFKAEIGRYQAKDTVVNKNEFLPRPDIEETQQQFYDWWFNHNTTPEIREQLKTAGFPYGLWDKYRLKYNWRLHMQFYKPTDKDTLRYNTYVNGEEDAFYKNELAANSYLERPVPFGMHIFFCKQPCQNTL